MASVIHRHSPATWLAILASLVALALATRGWPTRDAVASMLFLALDVTMIYLLWRK